MSNIATLNNNSSVSNGLLLRTVLANARNLNGVPHAEVPVSVIRIDESYQRTASGMANKIAAEWDNFKAGDVVLSIRDDSCWCIDGQNRVLAAKSRGQETINAIIYQGLTRQQEARLFADQSKNVSSLTSYDKLKAGYIAGDPICIEMINVFKQFKVRLIKRAAGNLGGYFTAISATYDNVKQNGVAILKWLLRLVDDSGWRNAPGAYGSCMVSALYSLYGKYGDEANTRKLIESFKQTSPKMLMANAIISYPDRGHQRATSAYIESLLKNN